MIQSESGQSVVLISMMVLSFLLFFGFVINTGVLITAKISLQTAADAAAYAGAAVQARQLNNISYLNYDLRRQYKKFIYRYVVIGNFTRDLFLKGTSPTDNYPFPIQDYRGGSSGSHRDVSMNVPVICIPITTSGRSDDTCVKANHPNTANAITSMIGPASAINGATATMVAQIQALEKVQSNICQARAQVNVYVALAWLFRGDINPQALQDFFDTNLPPSLSRLSPAEKDTAKNIVAAVTDRLGIMPRNIITKMRIDTLEGFLNQPPLAEVDMDKVTELEKLSTAEVHERTVMAFKSAYTNLSPNTFPEGVKMTELMNANQIQLKPVTVDFNTYVQQMDPAPGNPDVNCSMKVINIPVVGLPVGVINEQSAGRFVHYAVKLSAKARLFLPSPLSVDLEAVAGAKPFGSRIGPENVKMEDYVETIKPDPIINNPDIVTACSDPIKCQVPNLRLLTAPDTKSLTKDYLKSIGAELTGTPITMAKLQEGMKLATAPNPFEVGSYNIIPPPPANPAQMRYEFISYWSPSRSPSSAGLPIYRFYAPVFPEGGSNVTQKVKVALDKMFPTTAIGYGPQGYDPADMRQTIENQLVPYITKSLMNPNGSNTENNESITLAAVELPIPEQGLKPSPYWLTKSEEVLSSWAPEYVRTGPSEYNGSGDFKARFGFSVKFVTMHDLLQQGMQDTDGDLSKVNH